jgi:hypothetical protein
MGAGGGGRIALISTGTAATFIAGSSFAYPSGSAALTAFKTKVVAKGGTGTNATYPEGGAGTVYLKHSGLTYGDLIIDNAITGTAYSTGTGSNGATAEFLSATNNSSKIYDDIDANSIQIMPAGIPYVNKNDLYKNMSVHFWNSGTVNPLDVAHTTIVLSANGDNSFTTTGNPVPSMSNDDYNYRFVYRLDHLDIGGKAQVNMNGADLVLQNCDLHSAATTFDVPANSKITGNTISKASCTTTTTVPTTVNFTNSF